MHEVINNMKEVFGKFVSEYTRFQAIEDGILIDVSDAAKETGITLPTAVTNTVWNDYIVVPEEMKGFQDERGRLHDLLWMLYCAIKSKEIRGSQGFYKLIVAIPENNKWQSNEKRYGKDQRLVTLKSVCGPDDDGKAAITIMKPDQD